MQTLLRNARPPLDADLRVIPNTDLHGFDTSALRHAGAAMALLGQAIDKPAELRLTDTGAETTVEWRPDQQFGLMQSRQRADGVPLMVLLRAFAGLHVDEPATGARWPRGYFRFEYRGRTHGVMVHPQPTPIGPDVVVLFDDGSYLRYELEKDPERRRQMLEDLDFYSLIKRFKACMTRVVEPVGGEFATIGAAIHRAPGGTRIIVRAGTYEENLLVPASIQLLGEGADHVHIVSRWRTCLEVSARLARIHGIHFDLDLDPRCEPGDGAGFTGGRAVLEQCRVTSNSAACVAVGGEKTRPTIRSCTVQDGAGPGIFFYRGGGGLVEGCAISGNRAPGVVIRDGGELTLRECRVRGGQSHGILIERGGAALLEDCDLEGNARAGIRIDEGCRATLRGCRIRGNALPGVHAAADAVVQIEGCDIEAAGDAG